MTAARPHGSSDLPAHLFEDVVQNSPEATGFADQRRRQLWANMDDLSVFSFDVGIQRFRLLDSATAQIFQ